MTPQQEHDFLIEFIKKCVRENLVTEEQGNELIKTGLDDQEKVERVLRHGRAA